MVSNFRQESQVAYEIGGAEFAGPENDGSNRTDQRLENAGPGK